MRRDLLGNAALALLAASGLGAVVHAPAEAQEARAAQGSDATKGQPSKSAERQSLKSIFGGGFSFGAQSQRKRGPGWTQAQVQRMARKRRNVLKHRARCRRSKS